MPAGKFDPANGIVFANPFLFSEDKTPFASAFEARKNLDWENCSNELQHGHSWNRYPGLNEKSFAILFPVKLQLFRLRIFFTAPPKFVSHISSGILCMAIGFFL